MLLPTPVNSKVILKFLFDVSDARRVLEYYDAVWNVYMNVANEIQSTREDVLKPYDDYAASIPGPQQAFID